MAIKIYISGPMRGIPDLNFAEFDKAVDRAKYLGHVPISPADLDRQDGNPPYPEGSPGWLRFFAERDLLTLLQCDAIAVLPGWENSVGARMEVATAMFMRMPVLDTYNFYPLPVTLKGRTLIDEGSCATGSCGIPWTVKEAQSIANGLDYE